MKTVIFLLSLLANAVAGPLQRRQLPSFLLQAITPQMKSLKVENLQPTIPRENVQQKRLKYGPFKVRAANSKERIGTAMSMDPAGTAYNYIAADFPKDVTLLRTSSQLVYEDGSFAELDTGVYNHHQYFADMDKRQPSIVQCPNGFIPPSLGPNVIAGSATDKGDFFFTSSDGRVNAGFYVDQKDLIFSNFDVVNYTNDTKTIYALYDIQYVPGKVAGAMDTSLQVISVQQCELFSNPIIQAPPGQKKFAFKSPVLKFTMDGEIVAARGHVHDGGVSVIAKINGKEFCNSQAVYGGVGGTLGGMGMGGHSHGPAATENGTWATVTEMSYCHNPTKVKKGDILEFEANYDLEKHPARVQVGGADAEEMALITAFFAAAK